MREKRTNIKYKKKVFIVAIALSVLLVFSSHYKVYADIYEPKPLIVLMVGVKAQDLDVRERGILNGKRVIEIPRTNNWQQSIESTQASEVIVKQNTGFVGLYTPGGALVKSIAMADGSNPANQTSSSPIQTLTYEEEQDFGYRVGGRIDPYKPIHVYEPKNNARLSAGWGYNSHLNQPKSKRSIIVDFLDFAPLDTVTPLNYPGYFDQHNLTWAYGLGVIPHIGGLIARTQRAKLENQEYQDAKLTQGIPNYTEEPVTYYGTNRRDPTNPMVQDPNFLRMNPMPQAFNQQYPNYGNTYQQYE